jgi:hypothetical protein
VPRTISFLGVVVLFTAGALLAGVGRAADTTTTTTTEPATTEISPGLVTTVITTATVEQTTTRRVIVPTSPTTTAESTSSGTADWIWVLLGILAVGLIVLAVLLARRGGGGSAVPAAERRRRLDSAVGSWAMQGWALDSQTADSAVLRRGGELMLISIDEAGHVSTRPMQPPTP